MRGVRAPHTRTVSSRFLLPAGLLSVAALASLAMFFPGTGAGASGHADASQVVGRTRRMSRRVPAARSTSRASPARCATPATPSSAPRRPASTATSSPTATRPSPTPTRPQSFISAGQLLFAQTCSSCHGNEANGVGPDGQATIGPNLQGVGAATVDFWVSTGRMPAADVKAVEAERRPTRLTPLQALELAAWVNSLDPSVPAVPEPAPGRGRPVGRAGPLLAQLRRLPHHRGNR